MWLFSGVVAWAILLTHSYFTKLLPFYPSLLLQTVLESTNEGL
jgi:hypothetical protein